jgi:23S rRNA pseudouridine2605 synthase
VKPRNSSPARAGGRKQGATGSARPNPGVTARRTRVDAEAVPEDSRGSKRGAAGDARSRGGAGDGGRGRGDGGKAGPRGLKVVKRGPGAKVGSRGRAERPGSKVGSRGGSYDSGKPVRGAGGDTPPRRGSAVERLLAGGQPGDPIPRPRAIRDEFADTPPAKRGRAAAPAKRGRDDAPKKARGAAVAAKPRSVEGEAPAKRGGAEVSEAPAKRRGAEGGAPAKRGGAEVQARRANVEGEAPAKRRGVDASEAPAKRASVEDEAPVKRRADEVSVKRRADADEAPVKRRADATAVRPRAAKSADGDTPGVARSVRGWSETPTGKPKRAPSRPGGSNQIKGPERLAPAKVRLQKVLASAGVAARRKAEELIARGRVTVNGRVANELGVKVDPERDQIRVDGKVVQVETRVYFVLNKPDGVVCSAEGTQDAEGRPTVLSLLPTVTQRIYPVGRLDYHTRGVLILTNDGDLAAALTHPRHKVTKTYHVKFQGRLGEAELAALGQGITLDDGVVTRPAEEISIIKETETNTWVQITLRQGLNRQVRRMGDAIGHPVLKLIRVAVGPVNADGLEDGEFRPLTPTEVYDLMAAASR